MANNLKIASNKDCIEVDIQNILSGYYFDRESILRLIELLQVLKKNYQHVKFFSSNKKIFSLGFNPSDFDFQSKSLDQIRYGLQLGQSLVGEIYNICIEFFVNGFCLGAGLEFALSAQKINIGDNAKIMFSERSVANGFFPGYGGIYLMAKKLGLQFTLSHLFNAQYFGKVQFENANYEFGSNLIESEDTSFVIKIAESNSLEEAQKLSTDLFLKKIIEKYNK
jgi:hypothetical protein